MPHEEAFGGELDRGSEAKVYHKGDGYVTKAIEHYYSAQVP